MLQDGEKNEDNYDQKKENKSKDSTEVKMITMEIINSI